MAQNGEIRRIDTDTSKGVVMGNQHEYASIIHVSATERVQLYVRTIHGSGALIFELQDFAKFLHQFALIMEAESKKG